MDLMWTR
jgi:hypothetical protein